MSRPLARPAQRVLALLVLLAVGAISVIGGRHVRALSRPRPALTLPAGTPFPSLSLADFGGGPRGDLPGWSADSERGHAFLVLYISDACRHCGAEAARWDSLYRRAPAARAPRIIVIRAPAGSEPPHAAPFAARDLHDVTGSFARALKLKAVPTSYVLDADGKVVSGHVGQSSPRRLADTFASVALEIDP